MRRRLGILLPVLLAAPAGCSRVSDMRTGERVDQEAGSSADAAPSLLEVRLSGLRGTRGQVVCNLFDSEGDYDEGRAHLTAIVEANGGDEGALLLRFPGLAAGRYGIVCFHDEDGNQRLGTNFIGMPTEGVGCSNGAKGGFGHGPYYSDMQFAFDGATASLDVAIRYL